MSLIPEIDAFLGCPTPDAWIEAALADQETLLIDHKNCEFKAASTALSLIACHLGMNVRGGAQGVGDATTKTVVYTIVALTFIDLGFTAVFYYLGF